MKIQMPIVGMNPFWPLMMAKTVTVELVDIAPHLADQLTFALGPNPHDSRVWRVHNIETGYFIADGETKAACIRAAKQTLDAVTPEIAAKRLRALAKIHPDLK